MLNRRLQLALAANLMLVLACSVFGGQTVETPSPQTTEESGPSATSSRLIDEEGQPADPETLPADFVQALLSQVEEGETSRAKAIVTGLQLMANELPAEQVFGGQQVRSDSGWGMTIMARRLYQETDDADLKAELERLMAVVAPAQANLDAYSQPASSASWRPPGLSSSAPRQEAESCRDLHDSGFPTDLGSFPICLLYSEEVVGGSRLRVYYPFELGDDPSYLSYVATATEALRESQLVYSAMLDISDINLIFTLEPAEAPFAGTYAAIPGLGFDNLSDPCPISVYPRSLELPTAFFKQALAHEVFHCAQYWRRSEIGYQGAAWYTEGLATHFSNVVYPETNLEHSLFRLYFDVTSIDKPLPEMDYQSYIFFQYLENRFGNDYNLILLDTLPLYGESDAMAAALSSYEGMEDIFHEFGQAYLKKQIMDTSGAPVPVQIFFETEHTYEVGEELEVSRQSESFTLTRTRLKFDECGQFDIQSDLSSDQAKHSWKDVEQFNFNEVPTEMTVNCEGLDYWHLLTTTGDNVQLQLEIELAEEGRCDCCLIGTWEQTSTEIRNNLQQVMSGLGTVQSVSGRYVLSIFRDGSMFFFPEDYSATIQLDDEIFIGQVVGSAFSNFTLPEENQISSTAGPTRFVVTIFTEAGAGSIPFEPGPGALTSGGIFRYQCDDRSLTAIIPAGLAPFSTSTFQRISEAPEEPEFDDSESPPPVENPVGPDIFGSADVCPQLSLTGFTTDGNLARWTLANESSEMVEISALSLDWPPENSSLIEVRLDGVSIWEGSQTGLARLTEGWSGELADRQLDPGAIVPIELEFTGTPVGSVGYIHAVEFTNGCSAVDVR